MFIKKIWQNFYFVYLALGCISISFALPLFSQNDNAQFKPNAMDGNVISDFKDDPKKHEKFNSQIWDGGKDPWFEWWFYKFNIPDTDESFCFVYGMINPSKKSGQNSNKGAYVKFVNFKKKEFYEHNFDICDFSASKNETLINIGSNIAKANKISGNLSTKEGDLIKWEINIRNKWAFNAMGWGLYLPIATNIFWYPAQADAVFSGKITYKDTVYNFENMPGYQDKNWGKSFPAWWTWIASTNFTDNPNSALVVGGGRPKILNFKEQLDGVTIGLRHKDKIYSFRPNDIDQMNVDVSFGKWEIVAWNIKHKIKISAWAPPEKFIDLAFKSPDGNVFHDMETLNGEVKVELFERRFLSKKWVPIDTLHSNCAGIEYGTWDIENIFYNTGPVE